MGGRPRPRRGAHPARRAWRALHRTGTGPAAVCDLPVGRPVRARRAGTGRRGLGRQQRVRRHDRLARRGAAHDRRIRRALRGLTAPVDIRDARPEEFGRIGELRVAAYRADGFLNEAYADTLRALATDGTGEILA